MKINLADNVRGTLILYGEPLHLGIGGGQVIYNCQLFSLGLGDEQRRAIWDGEQDS